MVDAGSGNKLRFVALEDVDAILADVEPSQFTDGTGPAIPFYDPNMQGCHAYGFACEDARGDLQNGRVADVSEAEVRATALRRTGLTEEGIEMVMSQMVEQTDPEAGTSSIV